MYLSVEQKYYIMVLFVTLLLAYFLGITIAGIVDYRLKDAVINLPKPKNTVYVQLDPERDWRYPSYYRTRSYDRPHYSRPSGSGQSTTNINVSPTITSSSTSSSTSNSGTSTSTSTPTSSTSSPSTSTTESFKSNTKKDKKYKKDKKDKKDKKEGDTIEPFYPAEYTGYDTKITNLNRDVFNIDPFYYIENKKVYKDTIVDPNINAYSLAYDVSKKMTEFSDNNFPFIPANLEDLGDQYTTYKIDKKKNNKNGIRPANNVKTIDDMENEFKSSSKYEELPTRELRCPTFKGQRPWINSVNKHNIIVN